MDHASFCPPDVPCRLSWWNIPVPLRVVFFVMIGIALAVMIWGIVRRIQLWRRGQAEFGLDRPLERLNRTIKYGIAQTKVLRQRYPGVFHFAMFWGMVLLFIGTVLGTTDTDIFELVFKSKLLYGNFYVVYKVVLDLAALGVLIGLGMAAWRRYVLRPARLNIDWRFNLTLPLLGFIILTGLFIGALRLAVLNPAWGPAQVVAYPLSFLFRGGDEQGLRIAHRVVWTIHFAAVGVFFAALPFTNLFHIFSSPANIFVAPFRNKGALWPIKDLEQAERLGAARLTDFPQPRLVNFDACTECGRCQDVCPAYAAQEPLNPKYVILDLRNFMTEVSPALRALPPARRATAAGDGAQPAAGASSNGDAATPSSPADNGNGRKMVGDIIKHETLWACTTCFHCVYECPVLIEHVDAIVDMRRYLTLMEGDLPSSLGTTLTNIERSGNPWKQSKRKRAAWTQALDFEVPIMADAGEVDVLWWVGCAGAYDPRNQKVTRLFQQLAGQNIETLNQYKFRTILTQCPHCYNVLLNEYPQLGGKYSVVHHSEFIRKLLADGSIRVRQHAAGSLTYHDPCYLGRYNDMYDAGRAVATAGGHSLVEMARSRDNAMCCGGGGARVWMENEGKVRINYNRMNQILETKQEEVAVACPFCMIMLEDARGALDVEQVQIRDIAEIVAENLIIQPREQVDA